MSGPDYDLVLTKATFQLTPVIFPPLPVQFVRHYLDDDDPVPVYVAIVLS